MKSSDFPKLFTMVSKKLKQMKSNLMSMGISIDVKHTSTENIIVLKQDRSIASTNNKELINK